MGWLFWINLSQLSIAMGIVLWALWNPEPPTISQSLVYDLAETSINRYGTLAQKLTFMMEETARRDARRFDEELWRQVRERIEAIRRDGLFYHRWYYGLGIMRSPGIQIQLKLQCSFDRAFRVWPDPYYSRPALARRSSRVTLSLLKGRCRSRRRRC